MQPEKLTNMKRTCRQNRIMGVFSYLRLRDPSFSKSGGQAIADNPRLIEALGGQLTAKS